MLARDSTYGPRKRDSISSGREDYVDVEDEREQNIVRGGVLSSTLIVVDNGRTLALPQIKSSDLIMKPENISKQ